MKVRRSLLVPVFVLAATSCASRGTPLDATLDRYREAVARGDAAEIWRLSDARFRGAHDVAAVETALAEDRGPLAEVRAWTEVADAELADGRRLRLVREAEGWRVAEGGVEPARFDTPEHALATFFRAFETGRLDLVRAAMPERFREAFRDDGRLREHLASQRERVEVARRKVGGLGPFGVSGSTERIQVRGKSAALTYGPGLAVTFEEEEGSWRIVDVE